MKTLFICLIGLMLVLNATLAQAEQKFNPFSGQWETTYPESQLRYNPWDNTWQYVTPPPGLNSEQRRDLLLPAPQYNPYNGKWEFPR